MVENPNYACHMHTHVPSRAHVGQLQNLQTTREARKPAGDCVMRLQVPTQSLSFVLSCLQCRVSRPG